MRAVARARGVDGGNGTSSRHEKSEPALHRLQCPMTDTNTNELTFRMDSTALTDRKYVDGAIPKKEKQDFQ